MNRIEAITIIAMAEGKTRSIAFPHSAEMREVAEAVILLREKFSDAIACWKSTASKLERKIASSQKTYNRLLEENREVERLNDLHSFHECSSGLPKQRLSRYVVKLSNGDFSIDYVNQDGSWARNGKDVVKWMDLPVDGSKELDPVKNKSKLKKLRKGEAKNAANRT